MAIGEEPSQSNPIVATAAPRFSLVANAGKANERKIPCRRVVTILGRRRGCKVVMQHRHVAGVHVAIVNDGSGLTAVDLVTTHGTLLNGLKMEHEPLNDGDVLACSAWEFHVNIESPAHSGDADAHPFGLDPSPHVVALEHVATGRLLHPSRDVCVIGRRNGCDITIADNQVSRIHALLLRYFGRPAIFDLLSTNQTSVNDRPVQFQCLRDGDLIEIGESSFRVRLADSRVGQEAAGLKIATDTTVELEAEEPTEDMIDIKATESTQRWRIAEKMEKTARKR